LALQERPAEIFGEASHRLDDSDEAMKQALLDSVDESDVIAWIDLQPVQDR